MKLLLIALATIASATAHADDQIAYHLRCTLVDLSQSCPGQCNVSNQLVNLKGDRDSFALLTYKGIKYDIASADNTTSTSPVPRKELMITARDAATNKLVAAANVNFSIEVPSTDLQIGSDILLYCREVR